MAFIFEKVPEKDWELFDSYEFTNPISKKRRSRRSWTIDREREVFLVALGGQGSYFSEIPKFLQLIWKKKVINIQLFTHVIHMENRTPSYRQVGKIISIEIPQSVSYGHTDEIVELIKEAIVAHESVYAHGAEFTFEEVATPYFVPEVNK